MSTSQSDYEARSCGGLQINFYHRGIFNVHPMHVHRVFCNLPPSKYGRRNWDSIPRLWPRQCNTQATTPPLAGVSPGHAATKWVTIQVTWGVTRVHADWSSSNYSEKANFRIEIMELLAHRNVGALVRTFGWDWINRKIELTGVDLTEVYCITVNYLGWSDICQYVS